MGHQLGQMKILMILKSSLHLIQIAILFVHRQRFITKGSQNKTRKGFNKNPPIEYTHILYNENSRYIHFLCIVYVHKKCFAKLHIQKSVQGIHLYLIFRRYPEN